MATILVVEDTPANLALASKPLALMESAEGLVRVLHYVDAHRGRI